MLAIWAFGCTFGRKWFNVPFPLSWVDFHISVKEFLPIVIAFEIWGHLLSNSTVVLHVDNLAVVHVINKNSSRDPSLMQLMRRLMVLSLTHNIHFRAKHIEGVNNIAADLLPRLQVKEFQARFPYMDPACTPVSPALISLQVKPQSFYCIVHLHPEWQLINQHYSHTSSLYHKHMIKVHHLYRLVWNTWLASLHISIKVT